MKVFSEKKPKSSQSPAQTLGLFGRLLSVEDVLRRRLFPSLVRLPERLQLYYDRDVQTRQIPNGRRHEAGYAY